MATVLLKAVFVEAGILKKAFESAAELVKDANFLFTREGLTMEGIDESHIAVVKLNIPASGFQSYEWKKNFSIGLSFSNLINVMKCSSSNDIVRFEYAESSDYLEVNFTSEKKDRTSKFQIPLVNIEGSENFGLPDGTGDCVVSMLSSEFARTIQNLTKFENVIQIKITSQQVEFSCKSISGWAEISFRADETSGTSITTDDSCNLSFNGRYLLLFLKAAALSERVTFSMSDTDLLRVEFKLGTKTKVLGSIRYYLAPRVSDDDGLGY